MTQSCTQHQPPVKALRVTWNPAALHASYRSAPNTGPPGVPKSVGVVPWTAGTSALRAASASATGPSSAEGMLASTRVARAYQPLRSCSPIRSSLNATSTLPKMVTTSPKAAQVTSSGAAVAPADAGAALRVAVLLGAGALVAWTVAGAAVEHPASVTARASVANDGPSFDVACMLKQLQTEGPESRLLRPRIRSGSISIETSTDGQVRASMNIRMCRSGGLAPRQRHPRTLDR